MYWMALAAIPTSILQKIQSLMFNFLWSGDVGRKHFHLCSWDLITNPKHLGGWGIRNIFLFNSALVTNSVWCVLTKDGVWSKVIKDKYIPHCSIVTWLRSTTSTVLSASQTWRNLLKSLHLITHWLSWRPGSDHLVQVGIDSILGLGQVSFFTSHLLSELRRNHVVYLYQAIGVGRSRILSDYWKTGEELGLVGILVKEWDAYRKNLNSAKIQLQNTNDVLIWLGGDRLGNISVKKYIPRPCKQILANWRRGMEKTHVEMGFVTKDKTFYLVICGE